LKDMNDFVAMNDVYAKVQWKSIKCFFAKSLIVFPF
jgi:hypothetical protein